ncbi:MAG: hypothetical protein EF812_00695, partial [Methanosarcinales archaeon]
FMKNPAAGTYNFTAENVNATVTITETPTVSIGSDDNVSNNVIVPINITGASNIGAMDINITYDTTNLTAMSVGNETINVTYNIDDAAGRINVSFANYPSTLNGDGMLFNVTFHADAVGNSTLDITVKEAWTGDVSPQPVTPTTVNGYVNVTEAEGLPKNGDVNGDSSLNYKDGPYLVKYDLAISGFETLYADGDVNGDSSLNYKDGPYLVKYDLAISGFETLY